jgi:hypothetical protein
LSRCPPICLPSFFMLFSFSFLSNSTSLLVLPQRIIDERHSISLKCPGWYLGPVRYPSSATFIRTGAFHISLHGAEPFLRSRQSLSYSRISQHYMEPEGSLPRSQEPSTGPYPQPDQCSPRHPILSSFLRFILILLSHLRLYLSSGPFPSGFRMKLLIMQFSPIS